MASISKNLKTEINFLDIKNVSFSNIYERQGKV